MQYQYNQASDDVHLDKKKIIFRNPYTQEIITQVQMPRYIRLNEIEVYDLQALKNKIKMLYVDVLHRGYHPIKGFEKQVRNVFKHFDFKPEKTQVKAIGTIWRCLGRQIGRSTTQQDLKKVDKQIFDQLKQMRGKAEEGINWRDLDDNEKQTKNKYQEIKKELNRIQKMISKAIEDVDYKYRQQKNHFSIMEKNIVEIMRQQILKLERQIFLKTLVGIRESIQHPNQAELILEQAYPINRIPIPALKEILGEKTYWQKYEVYRSILVKLKLNEENLIVCHRCICPLNHQANISKCNDEAASLYISHSLLTDPYLYCNKILRENAYPIKNQSYIHPYLIYYPSPIKSTAICNRYFCNKCTGAEISQSISGRCSYCEGSCDCSRCQGMDLLTKMMAVLLDHNGNLDQIVKQFVMARVCQMESGKFKPKKVTEQSKATFTELFNCFRQNKIIKRRKQISEFQKIEYFSERLEPEAIPCFEKYKIVKNKIEESKQERKQRHQQEKEKIEQIQQIKNKLKSISKSNRAQSADHKLINLPEKHKGIAQVSAQKHGIYEDYSSS